MMAIRAAAGTRKETGNSRRGTGFPWLTAFLRRRRETRFCRRPAGGAGRSARQAGVVLEISDLDHAPPSVRSYLADLFLQLLETGEVQSAVGATSSCPKILFAFTMNLPDGKDEHLHGGIGFTQTASREDLSREAGMQIKRMLSGAFLSRVGGPVLFEPLGQSAMVTVLERAISGAVQAACGHWLYRGRLFPGESFRRGGARATLNLVGPGPASVGPENSSGRLTRGHGPE